MKTLRQIFTGFMAAAVVAYLLLAPPYLMHALERNHYREWMQPKQEPYTGILHIWHIVEFKPYQGSLATWLSERAAKIERRHNGVFFEVLAMTPEEAEIRDARGEKADIYSFPAGWAYAEMLQPIAIECPEYPKEIRDMGRDGGMLALPYAMSGYCLIINSEMAKERELILPEENVTSSWLQEAAETMTYERGRRKTAVAGLAGDAVTAARLGVTTALATYEDFLSGKAAMAIVDLRAAGDLQRQVDAGKGFAFSIHPLDSYTDEVQLLGIARDMEEQKLPYAEEYLTLVTGEDAQRRLSELGAFPAVVLAEAAEYKLSIPGTFYALYREPVSPNAFHYRRIRDALREAAKRALTGDASAQQDFQERFKELVP